MHDIDFMLSNDGCQKVLQWTESLHPRKIRQICTAEVTIQGQVRNPFSLHSSTFVMWSHTRQGSHVTPIPLPNVLNLHDSFLPFFPSARRKLGSITLSHTSFSSFVVFSHLSFSDPPRLVMWTHSHPVSHHVSATDPLSLSFGGESNEAVESWKHHIFFLFPAFEIIAPSNFSNMFSLSHSFTSPHSLIIFKSEFDDIVSPNEFLRSISRLLSSKTYLMSLFPDGSVFHQRLMYFFMRFSSSRQWVSS